MNENHFLHLKNNLPALVLAPMEGVTDFPMRALMSETGAFSFCVTEFLRVTQTASSKKTIREYLPETANNSRTPSGVPVVLQFLGGDSNLLAESAAQGIRAGASGIDLNFGCPAPTVNRHDGGATLLKFPQRIREIVTAVRAAVPKEYPVSAKLRLGWENPEDILINAEMAALGGASWITIHARTRTQGYKPPAHWKWVRAVKKNLSIPVIANGDLWTLDAFEKCREETQCEHMMLGRGALADPLLAIQVARRLGLISTYADAPLSIGNSIENWRPWIERFVEISLPNSKHPSYLVRRIKQWLQFAKMRQEIPWFEELKRMESLDAILEFISQPPSEEVLLHSPSSSMSAPIHPASEQSLAYAL